GRVSGTQSRSRSNAAQNRARARVQAEIAYGDALIGDDVLNLASAGRRDQSLVDARDRSFQSAPCFCQFIRMWRLVELFLPSATASLSPSQWNRTIAASPTTRILTSSYFNDKNFDFPLVALAMKVGLSSIRASEWL